MIRPTVLSLCLVLAACGGVHAPTAGGPAPLSRVPGPDSAVPAGAEPGAVEPMGSNPTPVLIGLAIGAVLMIALVASTASPPPGPS